MPAEVLDRLAALDLPLRWVRGNADREVVGHPAWIARFFEDQATAD